MDQVNHLPPPPISCEVDLSDFPRMPLDVVKLKESGFIVKATAEEFRAAVILWAVSWHQVPAGSLPSSDTELAYLAGYGRSTKEWLKVKKMALSKWVPCSDGRLYHPLIVENALDAWEKKKKQVDKSVKGAMARWHNKTNELGNAKGYATGIAPSTTSTNATGITTGNAKPMPNECQGRGIGKEIKENPPTPQGDVSVEKTGGGAETPKRFRVFPGVRVLLDGLSPERSQGIGFQGMAEAEASPLRVPFRSSMAEEVRSVDKRRRIIHSTPGFMDQRPAVGRRTCPRRLYPPPSSFRLVERSPDDRPRRQRPRPEQDRG